MVDEIVAHGGTATSNNDDVSDFQHAENMVKQAIGDFGRLDILVNNAGILRDRMLVNMAEQEWDPVISVHLKGHFAPTPPRRRLLARDVQIGPPHQCPGHQHVEPLGRVRQRRAVQLRGGQSRDRGLHDHRRPGAGPYGVTVNCLAPNARTRMTEQTFGSMPQSSAGFDPLEAGNISPLGRGAGVG